MAGNVFLSIGDRTGVAMTRLEEIIYANLKAELSMAVSAKPTKEIIKRIEYLMAEMRKLRAVV